MPNYNFKDLETGEVKTEFCSIGEMEQRLATGRYEVVFQASSAALVSGINLKPDAGFREVLKRIKRGNPRSQVNTFD